MTVDPSFAEAITFTDGSAMRKGAAGGRASAASLLSAAHARPGGAFAIPTIGIASVESVPISFSAKVFSVEGGQQAASLADDENNTASHSSSASLMASSSPRLGSVAILHAST